MDENFLTVSFIKITSKHVFGKKFDLILPSTYNHKIDNLMSRLASRWGKQGVNDGEVGQRLTVAVNVNHLRSQVRW